MANAKKMRISLMQFILLAYIIRKILGRPLYEVVQDLLTGGGSITDKVLEIALSVLVRLEEEGIEIAVETGVVTYVYQKFIMPAVGHRKLIDLGFAVLTL